MKALHLLLLLLLLPVLPAGAATVVVDGVTYAPGPDGGAIVSRCDRRVSGRLHIQETIVFDGKRLPITRVGDWAFRGCSHLTIVEFPATLTAIGYESFRGCDNLEEVSLPPTVQRIGGGAFLGCYNLIELLLPPALTDLGSWAFSGCRNLGRLTLPEGLKSIGYGAFENCTALESFTLPASVVQYGCGALAGCVNIRAIEVADGNPKYRAHNGLLLSVDGQQLVAWPPGRGGSAQPPHGVRVVCNGAFEGCPEITDITIPAEIQSIAEWAFAHSTGLRRIEVDDANGRYMSRDGVLFSRDGSLLMAYPAGRKGAYTVPDGVTSFLPGAFAGADRLSRITLPEGLASVANGAFQSCTALHAVHLPKTVSEVSDYAFCGCSALEQVTLPATLTVIKGRTFRGCSALRNVQLPAGVTNIGYEAFADCVSLKGLDLPPDVARIADWAFAGCRSLERINLPDKLLGLGDYAFDGCQALEAIAIPEGVSVIGDHAFSGCRRLAQIRLPRTITSIGNSAFSSCASLTRLTLPSALASLGYCAFRGCKKLQWLYLPAQTREIGDDAFRDCQALDTAVVQRPRGADIEPLKAVFPMRTQLVLDSRHHIEWDVPDVVRSLAGHEVTIAKPICRTAPILIDSLPDNGCAELVNSDGALTLRFRRGDDCLLRIRVAQGNGYDADQRTIRLEQGGHFLLWVTVALVLVAFVALCISALKKREQRKKQKASRR